MQQALSPETAELHRSILSTASIIRHTETQELSKSKCLIRLCNLLLLVIELSLRPVSRCLVNTAVLLPPPLLLQECLLLYLRIHWHCHSRLLATKVNVLAPTLIGGGASIHTRDHCSRGRPGTELLPAPAFPVDSTLTLVTITLSPGIASKDTTGTSITG